MSLASATCLWAGVVFHPLSNVKKAFRLSMFATLCILNICLVTFLFNDIVLAYAGCATSMALLYTGLEMELEDPHDIQGRLKSHCAAREISLKQGAWDMLFSVRGVGWENENPHLPPRPYSHSVTTSQFMREQFFELLCGVLLLDVASIYNRSSPALTATGTSLHTFPLFWQCCDLISYALTYRTGIAVLHTAHSMVSVYFKLSAPQDWVPAFGAWSDAYTLRRFWGRVWHQFFRGFLTRPALYLINRFNIRRQSNASAYIQLYTAFSLSALMFLVTDFGMMRRQTGLQSVWFFAAQAVGITVEDTVLKMLTSYFDSFDMQDASCKYRTLEAGSQPVVEDLSRRKALSCRARQHLPYIIGYAWVFTWFLYTSPPWIWARAYAGYVDSGMNLRFSVLTWKLDARDFR
ncbi:hypothetical protein CYLTODRAFT_484965 [Cylindrobasidium torrendii FP15055 ss-10]|uniref:Wax synthase domain-containing protein n=1 Tax=Cylindrobasidium torrendii FP15055 ss-10 TaxID=1314674 RepID=A0A0D7BW19_9AGAR|nr:hypothetical protein CYLTODRAFT_484965 [Cylindrobasidium torrendii FP15055 ss-10]